MSFRQTLTERSSDASDWTVLTSGLAVRIKYDGFRTLAQIEHGESTTDDQFRHIVPSSVGFCDQSSHSEPLMEIYAPQGSYPRTRQRRNLP